MKPNTHQEEILRTIRYRNPDPIANPETYSIQVLIDTSENGNTYEKIPVQFEFKYIIPLDPKAEKVINPKYEECEYEPFFNAGEIVIRKRIR